MKTEHLYRNTKEATPDQDMAEKSKKYRWAGRSRKIGDPTKVNQSSEPQWIDYK